MHLVDVKASFRLSLSPLSAQSGARDWVHRQNCHGKSPMLLTRQSPSGLVSFGVETGRQSSLAKRRIATWLAADPRFGCGTPPPVELEGIATPSNSLRTCASRFLGSTRRLDYLPIAHIFRLHNIPESSGSPQRTYVIALPSRSFTTVQQTTSQSRWPSSFEPRSLGPRKPSVDRPYILLTCC